MNYGDFSCWMKFFVKHTKLVKYFIIYFISAGIFIGTFVEFCKGIKNIPNDTYFITNSSDQRIIYVNLFIWYPVLVLVIVFWYTNILYIIRNCMSIQLKKQKQSLIFQFTALTIAYFFATGFSFWLTTDSENKLICNIETRFLMQSIGVLFISSIVTAPMLLIHHQTFKEEKEYRKIEQIVRETLQ